MRDFLDILKETVNIAAGNSSTALSDFLRKKIILTPPTIHDIKVNNQLDFSKGIPIERIAIGVFSRLKLGVIGDVLFVLDEKYAYHLIDLSYKIEENRKEISIYTEMGLSLIKELGNMVIGAYLTSLSIILNRAIVPPLPTFISGSINYIFDFVLLRFREKRVFLLKSEFNMVEEKIKGYFSLILPRETVKEIILIGQKILKRGKY